MLKTVGDADATQTHRHGIDTALAYRYINNPMHMAGYLDQLWQVRVRLTSLMRRIAFLLRRHHLILRDDSRPEGNADQQ